jgi:hypothetical protein
MAKKNKNITNKDKPKKKIPKYQEPKKSLKDEVASYDKSYTRQKYWLYFTLAIIATVLFGVAYQIEWYFLIVIGVVGTFIAPRLIRDITRGRYEEQKYIDAASYIEQMLYSFRRNSKILASLKDTYFVFPEGEMKTTIGKAIEYIQTAQTDGNIYKEALDIIGKRYDCRRIRSLHRYLVKVEGTGGQHGMGINALLTDRRLWMERVQDFKREKSGVLRNIIIATLFSSVVCGATMYMLPQEAGTAKNIFCMAYSTLYICVNLINVKAAIHRLRTTLNDIESKEREQAVLKKLHWFQNYTVKAERARVLKPAGIVLTTGIAATIITENFLFLALFAIIALGMYFVQPAMRYKNAKKALVVEVEKAYPDWLLELSLLLQTDNLHVALEKTIPDAPLVLKEELEKLADRIVVHPNDIEPYAQFFDFLPLPNIHSSMRLLYSIAEFGTEEEEKQISELIERNSSLMNKAELHKNNSRLSRVFILQFIPMGTSAMKLIVDMAVFLIAFISQTMS